MLFVLSACFKHFVGMRPLQAGILQAYIDRKSEDVISTHQTKIDEHKQMVSIFCFLFFCMDLCQSKA